MSLVGMVTLRGHCIWALLLAFLFGCCSSVATSEKVTDNGDPPRLRKLLHSLNENGGIMSAAETLPFGPLNADVAGASVPFQPFAPDGNSVIILEATNQYSAAIATSLGFTVVIANDTEWLSMTTEDFASYRAIILGDPQCSYSPEPVQAAESNIDVWGPAVDSSNIIIIGTDQDYHSYLEGGELLAANSISFVANVTGRTGLLVSLSCYYSNNPFPTLVPVLTYFGDFYVAQAGTCFNDVHIVASHPSLNSLEDQSLSGWDCSVHEIFTSIDTSRSGLKFNFLAIAVGNLTGAISFADGTSGTPYIVASGVAPVLVTSSPPPPGVSPPPPGVFPIPVSPRSPPKSPPPFSPPPKSPPPKSPPPKSPPPKSSPPKSPPPKSPPPHSPPPKSPPPKSPPPKSPPRSPPKSPPPKPHKPPPPHSPPPKSPPPKSPPPKSPPPKSPHPPPKSPPPKSPPPKSPPPKSPPPKSPPKSPPPKSPPPKSPPPKSPPPKSPPPKSPPPKSPPPKSPPPKSPPPKSPPPKSPPPKSPHPPPPRNSTFKPCTFWQHSITGLTNCAENNIKFFAYNATQFTRGDSTIYTYYAGLTGRKGQSMEAYFYVKKPKESVLLNVLECSYYVENFKGHKYRNCRLCPNDRLDKLVGTFPTVIQAAASYPTRIAVRIRFELLGSAQIVNARLKTGCYPETFIFPPTKKVNHLF